MGAFRWLTSALVIAVAATTALAARGVVTTNNGQTFEGEIVEEVNSVLVIRQGIQTRIPRDEIQSMRMVADPVEQIRKDRASLRKDDVAGRIALSRRAFQLREYALAREIAQEAADIDPNSTDAADMLLLIRRQVALEQRASRVAQAQRTNPIVAGAPSPELALPIQLLDARDMNALRQAELQAGDEQFIRVRFENDVRRRFASQPQTNARQFAELSAFQQALMIIREGDAQMRDDVILMGEPIAIRSFRTVQRSILNGCATAQCHGSLAGGNFVLFPLQETEQVTFTNFYLLMKYARINREQPAGIFGGAGARIRMIDRQRPEQSLLLQYGLPRQFAEIPHPDVPGFRPLFVNANDPVYRRVFAWISDGLRPVDVVYDIRYVSPVEALSLPGDVVDTNPTTAPASPAAAPATTPATAPDTTQPTQPAQTAPTTRPSIPVPPPPGQQDAAPRPSIPVPPRPR